MQSKIINTIIGEGASFEGILISNHDIRVEGTIKGKVQVNGNLILEENGILDAEVVVTNAKINGKVLGNLKAIEKIELEEKAQVTGDIQTKDLILHEGAVFKGNCSMNKENN